MDECGRAASTCARLGGNAARVASERLRRCVRSWAVVPPNVGHTGSMPVQTADSSIEEAESSTSDGATWTDSRRIAPRHAGARTAKRNVAERFRGVPGILTRQGSTSGFPEKYQPLGWRTADRIFVNSRSDVSRGSHEGYIKSCQCDAVGIGTLSGDDQALRRMRSPERRLANVAASRTLVGSERETASGLPHEHLRAAPAAVPSSRGAGAGPSWTT